MDVKTHPACLGPALACAALACAALLLLLPAGAAAQSVSISIDYGETTACSGPLCDGEGWMWPSDTAGWMGGIRSFPDPVPSGALVTGVDAYTIGRCDGRTTDIAVNGNNLGTVQYTGTSCVCNSDPCSMTNTVSGSWPGGMPGYVYGGSNEASLPGHDPNYVIVSLELTIHYTIGCEGGAPNGTVEGTEECDDGNSVDTDSCTNNCRDARCGDGIVRTGVEECDDGIDNSDTEPDACRTTCEAAGCGDGVLDTGETCDDGTDNSDTVADACRTTCEPASCGDGVTDTGEACDDGVDNSNTRADACRTTCELPRCGDYVVDTGEECDEGESGSSVCLPSCEWEPTFDAGPPDAGPPDAGAPGDDAGPGVDAGPAFDAGPGFDAGPPRSDAGVVTGRRGGRRGGCGCVAVGLDDGAPGAGLALLALLGLWRWRRSAARRRAR